MYISLYIQVATITVSGVRGFLLLRFFVIFSLFFSPFFSCFGGWGLSVVRARDTESGQMSGAGERERRRRRTGERVR